MMQNDKRANETTPAAADKPTPNGNIGVGSAGTDIADQPAQPVTPDTGSAQHAASDEPGLVGREESGVQGEQQSRFTGDEPHLPGQTGAPGDTDTGTHYLPEGEDAGD